VSQKKQATKILSITPPDVDRFSKFFHCRFSTKYATELLLTIQPLHTLKLQIYYWICQWNNFENQSIFSEVSGKIILACFWLTV